ncbi:MAG: hypothetical protein WA172_23130 [Terriglobales bacterium]
MKRPFVALMVCVAFAVAVFLPAMKPVEAAGGQQATAQTGATLTPAEYCVKKGGEVDGRQPYFNTNDDNEQNWLQLSGTRQFCKFTSKKDGSRIYVLL